MEVKIHRKVDAPELEAEDNARKTKGENLTGKEKILNNMASKLFKDTYLVQIVICESIGLEKDIWMSFNNFKWINKQMQMS